MRKTAAILLLGALALLLVFSPAGANPRATTVDAPDGNTYYVYAYPHGLEIWQESNGVGVECAQVSEGYPVGHAFEPTATPTGLQRVASACAAKPDTLIQKSPV